ncbi:hypothetical protein KL86SPO_70606 [uncultured Sporomusa sp.]|uniref:Uncharacterized protein n=1 Tax=uncultured Sporomusa sp. TaxID=307249 RepID=A0A212M1T2_9FIRM|nr:hypothetical protein KL86SPO_70606 [uncultured Sporomusa sp.]
MDNFMRIIHNNIECYTTVSHWVDKTKQAHLEPAERLSIYFSVSYAAL